MATFTVWDHRFIPCDEESAATFGPAVFGNATAALCMDIFDLLEKDSFWCTFFAAAGSLTLLRCLAEGEAKRPFAYDPVTKRNFLRTPGVCCVLVDGVRVIGQGPPRARFFNPIAYFEFISKEPTLVVWYVVGWLFLSQRWETMILWAGAAVCWRGVCDVLLAIQSPGNIWNRLARTVFKVVWAASSGLFFACMTATALSALMAMLLVGAFAAGAGGGSRSHRRK